MNIKEILLDFLLILCGCYVVSSVFVVGRIIYPFQGIAGEKIAVTNQQFQRGLSGGIFKGSIFLALEDRPASVISFSEELPIETIEINISGLSVSATNAQIYYASKEQQFAGDRHVDLRLMNGKNRVYFDQQVRANKLRIDLTDTKGIFMDQPDIFVYTYDSRIFILWLGFISISIIFIIAYVIFRCSCKCMWRLR